jgi:hypothetical protein
METGREVAISYTISEDVAWHRRDLRPREDRRAIPVLGLPLPDPPLRDAEWIAAYRRWAG